MFLKLLAALSVVLGVYLHYAGYSLDDFMEKWIPSANNIDNLFTDDELSKYDGVKTQDLYLSLMGKVYDVSKGRRHYEPGSNYNIFVGRDASRSFITGEFDDPSKELDDVLSLSPKDLVGLETWMQMYEEQYVYKGKLIGRFYDSYGRETEYLRHVKVKQEEGKIELFKKEEFSKQYPSCNSEWSADISRVWCSTKSGGIDRDWVGVPRLMHSPGLSEPHCVCINPANAEHLNNPQLKVYEDCDESSDSCNLKR